MPAVQSGDCMRAWGSRYARLVLERCNHNKRQACRVLGITYHMLNLNLTYRPRDRTPRVPPSALVPAPDPPEVEPEMKGERPG